MPAEVVFDQNILSSLSGIDPVVIEATGLNIDIASFSYTLAGVTSTYVGATAQATAGNALNYVFLNSGGSLVINQSGYPSDGVLLARVETGPASIIKIIVDRARIQTAPIYTDFPLYPATSAPPSPLLNNARIYARSRHTRPYLDLQSPTGRDVSFQPFLGNNRIVMWMPENTTTIRTWGMPITNVGTVSHPTLASTNLSTSCRRWRLTSAATANSASENRCTQLITWIGNAAGLGGFTWVSRISLATIPSNHRSFFGLTSATGAISTTQSPSALTNCIGFAYDSGESNFSFQTNNASGTANRTNLGANFPATSTTAVYTFFIFSAANGSEIAYRAVREDTGDIVDGTTSTDLPLNTQFLSPHLHMNNGGTASACAFDCSGLYIESDY